MAKGALSLRLDSSNLEKTLQKLYNVMGSEAESTIDNIAKIGEDSMRSTILSSGTDWSAFRAANGYGSTGRVLTGQMLSSISSRIRNGTKQFLIEVGFIKGPREDYYKYQEYGIKKNKWRFVGFGMGSSGPNASDGMHFAPSNPKPIQGMFALRDAKLDMQEVSARELSNAKRRIKSRMKK
jgi:hypothetical protein